MPSSVVFQFFEEGGHQSFDELFFVHEGLFPEQGGSPRILGGGA